MSVASDSPSKGDSDETNDKVFVCPSLGCNQKFDSEDSFAVHKQKHQMTLTLGPSKLSSLADVLPVDQTPTPTRFLHLGNQFGLFEELNPFDKEFKTAQKEGITSKQRRVAQHMHALNSKNKSPSTPQPVQVIAITPTLPSPVTGLPSGTSPFLVPSLLPSPQGLHIPALPGYTATSPMQVPASILSPTLMPFTPGIIPGMPTSFMDAQQRAAAFTQAMFAAAVSAGSPLVPDVTFSAGISTSASDSNQISSAVSAALSASSSVASVRKSEPLNIPSIVLPKQERPTSVMSASSESSNNYPELSNAVPLQQPNVHSTESYLQNPTNLIPQYPVMMQLSNGQTCVSATLPSNSITGHSLQSAKQQQIDNTQSEVVASHPPLGHRSSTEFGSNPNLLDAKQKLKETLTGNKPSIQHPSMINQNIPVVSTVASNFPEPAIEQKPPGRKRGRQSQDIDPDIKRQRFLERNRAAASRCRNKKKQWVNGLESKAKTLSQINIQLQNEIAALKDEIATLKQLLLSHRDCPIMKMQQQTMNLAGINLDLGSSGPMIVKSESNSVASGHPPLVNSLSSQSLDERTSGSSHQSLVTSNLSNGSMYSSLPTSSSTS